MIKRPVLRVEYVKDDRGKWRWTATHAANGLVVGASSQGYARKAGARANALLLLDGGAVMREINP